MILVTGATGNAGSQVVRAALERGLAVRAFVRDLDRARRMLGDDVELAPGDFADPASVRAALGGVRRLVLSCADDPRRVGWETDAIRAAAEAGVRRIVRLSTIGAAPGAPVAFWDWHGRVDAALRDSGVPAVVLRSSFYMSNLLAAAESVAREGVLAAPAGDARIAMIDPRDVGAAAAAALAGGGHEGRTYELTGPEAITYARAAAELAEATGRPVAFVDLPAEAARAGLAASGVPGFVAEQLVAVFGLLKAGASAGVTDAVERLTGRPPRPLAVFAREHVGAFAPLEGAGAR